MTPEISFDQLPLKKEGPFGNAWGRFGATDQLGTLNLLTPDVVADAAKEIKTGDRVSLDWRLNMPSAPMFGRQAFVHEIRNKAPRTVNDDVLHFNTQCSTQWDGLRHYGYQEAKVFYNGVTQKDIESSNLLGIDVVAENGGVVGRGVLLDYVAHAEKHGLPITPFESRDIPISVIKDIAREQAVSFRPGDILFVRSGFVRAYEALSDAERAALAERPSPDFAGVQAGHDTLRWLWENQFSAVAGDAIAFERAPVSGPHAAQDTLHQWLLAGWGCPIGEMFDLEKLAEKCRQLGRWTFFVSSVPLKVPGGVASPPNAVAIF
ncbi:uncharacterized protein PV09_01345 [Verruconis gallopava]|uniref:Cyclase n=1 Tax=Verruconis gallopava TaxID=253628 RepID=A0A0D1Z665_9PEZI|nr:uncharacterized protein PV09_01345 [Verruconis gallopava]KIW08442.1 hypothetical protein PV09_01345 [Verruconis gallopava]